MSEIVKQNVSLTTYETVEQVNTLAQHLIDTKSLPSCWNTTEKTMLGLQTAKELGLAPSAALNNMLHFFEGRVVIGVHGIATLMRNKGVYTKILEDAVYVKKDNTVDIVRNPDNIADYIDRRTTVLGIQYIKNPDGTIFDKIETPLSFYWSEADAQGLLSKSNWKKMPIIMMRTRALTLLGRFLGVFSNYEVSEIAEITNKDITVDHEGEVTFIK